MSLQAFELFLDNQHPLHRTVPLVDDVGRVNGILAVVSNETKRKQMEGALAQSQRMALLGSWKWDLRTNRVIWSDGFYQLFGWDGMQGLLSIETWLHTFHCKDREAVETVVTTAIEDIKPHRIGTAQDITTRKQTEERLTASLRENRNDPGGRR